VAEENGLVLVVEARLVVEGNRTDDLAVRAVGQSSLNGGDDGANAPAFDLVGEQLAVAQGERPPLRVTGQAVQAVGS
jgi:hypothetical protein